MEIRYKQMFHIKCILPAFNHVLQRTLVITTVFVAKDFVVKSNLLL